MKTLILSMFTLVSFSQASHAQDAVQCRFYLDAKANKMVLTNIELTSPIGEKLSEPCLTYFMKAATSEVLPVINHVPVSLFMNVDVTPEEQANTIDTILKNSPRIKTAVEVKFFMGTDDQGMADVRATLSAKPNY